MTECMQEEREIIFYGGKVSIKNSCGYDAIKVLDFSDLVDFPFQLKIMCA